jgi:tetratricopeptide (TPR) repeat protein
VLGVAAQSNSRVGKDRPLNGLALIELTRGNYSRGLQLAQETYRISRASGKVWGELNGIRLQALCYKSLGNFKQCLQLLDEGKELIVRAGVQGGQMEIFLMNAEAMVHQYRTEYSSARRIQEAMLRQTSAVLSPVEHGHALINIASLDIVTGADANDVSLNLDAALTAFQSAQYPRGFSFCDCNRAALQLREGDTTGARIEYIRLFSAVQDRDNLLAWSCLQKLADCTEPVHAEMESARWAVVFLAFALRPVERSPIMVHQALRRLGDTFARQSADDMALSVLTIALDGFTQMDVHQSRAECMGTIGDVYLRRGDLSKAREMWEAARPLFECSEQQKEVTRIDERLQTLGVAQKFEALPKAELQALQRSDTEGEEQKLPSLPEM